MPKPLSRQSKQLLANLISYLERERDNQGPLLPLKAVRERAAHALQLNLSTVSSVSQTIKSGELLRSPKKTRPRRKPVRDVDDFDMTAIRNVIYEMYANRQHVTKQTLLQKLKERDIFQGGKTSLGDVLKKIGFKWAKDNPRRGLMEVPHIALARIRFLQSYVRNLNAEHPHEVVFLDETWVFENGTVASSWQDDCAKSVKRTKVDGHRYIVLHAGNRRGFIPGASLIFSSKTKNPDYHGEMNHENFLKWFEEQLLKNLEEPSIIVLDNASYHSTLVEKIPNTSWRKAEIKEWLQNHNLEFDDKFLKMQLLELVARNKPPKIFVVDQMAEQYGHRVLRLPPYHCLFNAIENVWAITKTYYNKHIGRDGFGTEKAMLMWREALNTITPQMWLNTVEHTEKEIKKWWEREVGFDREDVAPLIINVTNDDSDSSSYSSSDND